MLSTLHVENYVLIDSLDIAFPEGLVIITGQTGAGKSILIGALSLVLGAKADAALVGEHGETCVVEAEFNVQDAALQKMIEDNDLDWDGGRLVIRRVVSRSGRSRSFVNDAPVPQGLLPGLSSRLIDIHSQHQTLLLADGAFQMSLLDHYAGNEGLAEECRTAFQKTVSLQKEWTELSSSLSKMSAERDYKEARLRRLEEAKLREGEIEALELEQRQLANAEEIKESLFAVQEAFSPSGEGQPSLNAALTQAERLLRKVSKFIPAVGPLAERAESSRLELEDILAEVEAASGRIEVSEGRLQEVEERLSLLYDLLKRYGAATVAELIAEREALSAALYDSSALEERKAELEKALASETAALNGLAAQLHEARVQAAAPFAEAVKQSLHFLELEQAAFEVDIREVPVHAAGMDSVRFKFSASGQSPIDVAKCASGGELSRIMLSLKAMMARYTAMPTLMFDEIDTGVSGSAADRMGSMICEMGRDMQVFAITHLPQVAAKGNAHYLVEKVHSVTSIRRLSDEERIMEVARMLSASEITPAAIENAKTLLS